MSKSTRAPDAPGMRGERSRTMHGPLREKRGDTRVDTIEKKYDVPQLGVSRIGSGDFFQSALKKRQLDNSSMASNGSDVTTCDAASW